MFKLPYLLEGISNIFKPILTNEEDLDNTKGAENYRGKLYFDANACIGCGICIRVEDEEELNKIISNNTIDFKGIYKKEESNYIVIK